MVRPVALAAITMLAVAFAASMLGPGGALAAQDAPVELVTGPLNAGIFPIRDVDPTLRPEVLSFYGPATAADVTTWAEAKRWFNFGTLEVARDGSMTLGIVNTGGERVFALRLEP